MRTQTYFPAVLLYLAAMLALAACGSKETGSAPASGGGMPPPEVDVLAIAPGSVVLTQDLPGRLEAYRTAQIRARVEGIIEKRRFAEGSDVNSGDTLFLIDPRNYQTAFDSARADVGVARQTVERYKPLLEANAISQQDYDLAVAKLKQAEATLSRAQLDLENAHVPAPISGRIGRAQVTEGALVGRGEATLLATVEQVNPIYADFTQPGADLLRLQQAFKAGELKRANAVKVALILADGSVYQHPGRLLFSDLAVDPGTGSVSLRAEFPNPKHDLLPGMFVRIRLPEAITDKGIRVPQRAVQTSAEGQFIMLVDKDGKVAPRPVKTGSMSGDDFIIAEGLASGDQVIVNGLQKVRPGATVKPVPWSPQQSAAAPATPSDAQKK